MLVVVLFSAVIPLMTVVNYSVQDTFGEQRFFWAGLEWFQEILHSDRVHAALGAQSSSPGSPSHRDPARHPRGALHAEEGLWASVCLVLMALPLLIPWNVVGTIWQIFGRVDIGLLGHTLEALGINYNYTNDPIAAWFTVVIMDVWHWTSLVALLAYAGLQSIPQAYYQAAKIDGAAAGRSSATSSCRR